MIYAWIMAMVAEALEVQIAAHLLQKAKKCTNNIVCAFPK
jgi:hypothetical protein